jgi:hypothetical protein
VLKNLVYEAEELQLIKDNDKYTTLNNLLSQIDEVVKDIHLAINPEEINSLREESDKLNVDINDLLIEQEVRILLTKPQRSSLLGIKRKAPIEPKKTDDTIAQGRSRRNISVKIDKDYYYDKEFIENFKNNIGTKSVDDINDNVAGLEDQDKIKSILKNINKPKVDPKEITRKNTITTLEMIIENNSIFAKQGSTYINKLAKEVEDDLANTYSGIDIPYKDALSNISKTIKELENYTKVSTLITKGKLNLLKVAKYPHGKKFFDKLKKIETGDKQKPENKPVKQKEQPKKTDDSHFLTSALLGMKELYSSLEPQEIKKEEKPKQLSNLTSLLENDNKEDNDNDSLKSLSIIDDNVRFSPGYNVKSSPLTKNDFEDKKQEPTENIYNPFNLDIDTMKRKNYYLPFFYDPMKIRQSDARSISEVTTTPSKTNEEVFLQIWKGSYKLSKYDIRVQMISKKSINEYTQLPALQESINITSKANTKEVINYIEKNLKNTSKLILYGWLEIQDESYSESYKKIADELDKNEKTGYICTDSIKYYFFPLTQRYPKLYKVIHNDITLYNKDIMSKIDKILVYVIVGKHPLPSVSDKLNPVVLDIEANMSPITSDDEDDGDNYKNTNLEDLLKSDDIGSFEDYVNTHFSNLSQEEMLVKLMSLNEDTRKKLLTFIMNFQMKETKTEEPYQDESDDIGKFYLMLDEPVYNTNQSTNDNLSYMGFSGVNTNLLKKEIMKNQNNKNTSDADTGRRSEQSKQYKSRYI